MTQIEKAEHALDSFFDKVEKNQSGTESELLKVLVEDIDNQVGVGPTVSEYFEKFDKQFIQLS